MRLTEIYEIADRLAPFALSREYCDRYGAYDNSGILADCGGQVSGVLFSLDCSLKTVEAATERGANVLFTHHPAIYSPIKRLGAEDALTAAIKAGVSVLSAHLNLDCAPDGIDESLMEGLGGENPALMNPLSSGGYGRAYALRASSAELLSRIETRFCTRRTLCYGGGRTEKVASFCGAGMDEAAIAFALREGADTIVTSDGKHHLIALAAERGLNVYLMTHYASENYGFRRFYEKFKNMTDVPCGYFTDDRLL